MASSKIAGGSLKSHYVLITSVSSRCARVDSPSDCLGSGASPVLPDPSVPPAALDAQQRLRGSVCPRDVRHGREVARCRGALQSIAQSRQGPETPVHRLFPPRPPAERVSLPLPFPPPPLSPCFPLIISPSQPLHHRLSQLTARDERLRYRCAGFRF